MRYLKRTLPLFAMTIWVTVVGQHTPLTSQYLFNGLVINPAYAGSREALTATLTHRQQWVGFEGAPITQTISVHAPIRRSPIGVGVLAFNDRIGVSNESGVLSNFAYRLRFPSGKLSLGIGAGFTVLRADWTQVATQQQDDPTFSGYTRGALRPNFSGGAFYYAKKWFAGASMPFVLIHNYDPQEGGYNLSEERFNLQPMLTGGYVMEVNDDFKMKPSTMLRYRIDSGVQADISANVIYKDKVWGGISYRTGDALIGTVEVLPNPQWRIGYAYDLGLSAIRQYHSGSHEILVQYEFGYRIRVRDPRYF